MSSEMRLAPDLTLVDGRFEEGRAVAVAHPSLHPPTNPLKNVVYAMSPQAVTDVWVRGRQVVKSQRLTTLDQDALMARVRVLTRDWKPA